MKNLLVGLFLFTFVVSAFGLGAPRYPTETPPEVKAKYAHLYTLPVVALPDGSQGVDKGRLFRRDGVNILFLKGDRYEMAFQHGRLLRPEIASGALPQAALMFEKTMMNGVPQIPLLTPILIQHFKNKYPVAILEAGLAKGTPGTDLVLSDAYGLSDGSGTPLEDILMAAVGPESLQVMLGERMGSPKHRRLDPIATVASQCSAFVAWGKSTLNGEMVIGRNTDYPLNGSYDRHPTVIYFSPTDGTQKYMAVTSAGLHNSGVVGMNEAGIYIGVHTVPSRQVSSDGLPVFMGAQKVLRTAKTFDEAKKLFLELRPAAGWTYLLVSTKEKKVASIELNSAHAAALDSTGTYHVQTNHYRTPTLAPDYLHLNVSVDEDSWGRLARITRLINESPGKLNHTVAMNILADKYDPYMKEVRGIGSVVAVHTTMTSVVVRPASNSILVATGTAPVSLSSYLELPLVANADPDAFSSYSSTLQPNITYHDEHPRLAEAEQKYIQAKIAYEIELNPARAYEIMTEVLSLDSDNPAYHFVAGILALKSKDSQAAAQHFDDLAKSPFPPGDHYRRLGNYYLGRIFADDKDDATAEKYLREAIKQADPKKEHKLIEATEHSIASLGRRFRRLKLNVKMLPLMMQQADMVDYK